MPIHLYQSKKAKRYIGQQIYHDLPWAEDQIDPLTLWYVDVFFIQRERYLVLANPLTKFTFFIFRYSRKTHLDFFYSFIEKLTHTLKAADIDPTNYIDQCDFLIPFESTNKSASSHLSQTKTDYQDMISTRWHGVYPPDDEDFYNTLITKNLVSFNKKDLDYPSKRFYHELILRRWD